MQTDWQRRNQSHVWSVESSASWPPATESRFEPAPVDTISWSALIRFNVL